MKIALASDLHLEYEDINLKNTQHADALILSGDIIQAQQLHKSPKTNATYRFRGFFDRVSAEFPIVIYVAGNHEFYHCGWQQTIKVLKEECSHYDNVYFLEQDTMMLGDYTFIGATLWTDCNKCDLFTLQRLPHMMADFCYVHNEDTNKTLKPVDTVDRHYETLDYFRTALSEHTDKVVIVGHHAPLKLSVHSKYQHELVLNGAFHSDLSELILDNPQIKLWTHGHTHDPFDYMLGTTRIVCNPRGYPRERENIFSLKFLEIDV